MKVYFIGAGPGDPELLTIKGRRIIQEADVIVYAGSLVNPAVLQGHKKEAAVYDSSSLNLPEVLQIMIEGAKAGKTVARVHSGDPSIYGAVREQVDGLAAQGIDCEVVPGVSSFTAAAAALKAEYTLPGVSQAVILTRQEGRTPVPDGQGLAELARIRASLAVFLSAHLIEEVAAALIPAYGEDGPAAVVQKVTWPDEKIIRGTLKDIARKARKEGIEKTALVLVGGFLGNRYQFSKLYDPAFSHGFRGGRP
ncbi:MAG: precorrin-4 C(11)-methyltransferase [Peptococcaceae bacterium]|jgi:precorrin-4/cobalt-precorrin-4 C11-methyltransferase|nr:precorrin-4 C(11)-methyltransferase [Peptococcaceae bacterium]MDH7525789.1 precorrin-4 C(11)-methyltransferase [Peptococcaceae bacterium]